MGIDRDCIANQKQRFVLLIVKQCKNMKSFQYGQVLRLNAEFLRPGAAA